MSKDKCRLMIHLIDEDNNKVEIPNDEWIKMQEEGTSIIEKYEADLEFYLSHGKEAKFVFDEIETKYHYSKSNQQNANKHKH